MVRRINQLQPVSVGSRYDHLGLAGESLAQSDEPVAAPRIFSVVMEQQEDNHVLFKTQENT
jgi:hypothetical protein